MSGKTIFNIGAMVGKSKSGLNLDLANFLTSMFHGLVIVI